ncbi:MAG TPA: threonine-phosphate decarboxylase, partial [Hyphomonas sp.]|nr:threonine-phosphate decarboxylase [Hyphomonas sp.]
RAYQDTSWQVSTRARLDDARRRLDEILVGTGIKEIHGTNLFRFVECEDAHLIWRRLAERGIYVRRFSWSNQHLRFGLIANEAAETRLLEALSLSV